MPSALFFDGRITHVPGAVSKVDASALESVGLGASGIVAILGTAQGGVPASALPAPEDFQRFSSSQKMIAAYRAGQLFEVADMVFAPGKDDAIPGGAQQVVAMKVNQDTQSTGSLLRSGNAVLNLTSRDYGAHTTQINAQVADGTNQGKRLTIKFEDVTEVFDDVGGGPLFTLKYVPGSYGYQTAVASVDDSGDLQVTATRYADGHFGDATNPNPVTNAAVEIVSSSAGDTTQTVTLYGLVAGVPTTETLALNGTTTVTGVKIWDAAKLLGVVMSVAAVGTVTVKIAPGGATVFSMAPAALAAGALIVENAFVAVGSSVTDTSVTITTQVGSVQTLTGLTGATAAHVGRTVKLTGCATPANNGTFVIASYVGTGSVTITNAAGVAADANSGAITAVIGALSVALNGTGTPVIAVFGKNNSSVVIAEVMTLTGAVPVQSALDTWASIDVIAMTTVATNRTLTLTATAAKTTGAAQSTLVKLKTYMDARQNIVGPTTYGFIFAYGTGQTSYAMSDVDILTGVNILGVNGSFTADLTTERDTLNNQSQLVTAAIPAGAAGVPDNTAAPMYLAGGADVAAVFQNYVDALNMLKKVRVNTIVDLSGDPAVAAQVDGHCAYMCGAGKSERDWVGGLLNAAKNNVPTKAEARTQALALNSRHGRVAVQALTRYNRAGEVTEFLPPFMGAIIAGMQAGSPVGTSLTHKYLNALKVRQDTSWNPTDDADEMIQMGVWIVETVDGKGRRCVRDTTTHLSSDNLAFTEGSVNAAVNYNTYNFRNAMEDAVGRGGINSVSSAMGKAQGILHAMVKEGTLLAWRSLQMEKVLEKLYVSVEMAVDVPTLFVPITIHLINPAQSATA